METTDFGAPNYDGHRFVITIPADGGSVRVVENLPGLHPRTEHRLDVEASVWQKICRVMQRDFNARLKKYGVPAAEWKVGTTYVDRLLGKELCVLARAASKVPAALICTVIHKWLALHPENRWHLCSVLFTDGDKAPEWRAAFPAFA